MPRNNREKLQDGLLHCRVPSSAKEEWKLAASAKGKTLSRWVIETLNARAAKVKANRS